MLECVVNSGSLGKVEGKGVPLFSLKIAVICPFDLSRLHEHLRRGAIDALLEAWDREPLAAL